MRRRRRPTKGPMIAAVLLVAGGIAWSLFRRMEHLDAKREVERAKFVCKTADDCTNSCSQGAVSKSWLAAHAGPDCVDGCTNQLTAPPQCIQLECVAFAFDPHGGAEPHRNDACTKMGAHE